MHKLVAMYQRPPHPAAFDRHYTEVHLPLLRVIPGLLQLVVKRSIALRWGEEPPFYLFSELHFRTRTAFDFAMASPQHHAAQRDLQSFAAGLVTHVTLWEK